ncbi:MAG TPA: TauD/TfdA family dioxygenase [Thermoanaerobaculia bacterium]
MSSVAAIDDLATMTCADLEPVNGRPLILRVDQNGTKTIDWAQQNREHVERLVQTNGALLIRGLKFVGSQQFGTALSTLFGSELLQYVYRSTPRTELRGNVYTATEYHPDLHIPQHNENAYSNCWAMRLGFLCTLPSEQGGATPICDSAAVYAQIPAEVRERFERHGVLYVRNYSEIDLHWKEVFQTEDRAAVEAFCEDNHLQYEWLDGDRLRTRQINQASAVHPVTGAKVWFNQAHLFHVSSLEQKIQDQLLSVLPESDLPRNTYYGDGSPIEAGTLQQIRDVYARNTITFEWQRNDLLLIDNMLFSHGRAPYSGNRQVLVGMARPIDADRVETRP